MDNDDKAIGLVITALCVLLLAGLVSCIYGTNCAKQLMLKELGVEATVWQASGYEMEFLKGRLAK